MNEIEIPDNLQEACDKAWGEMKDDYGEDILALLYIDHNLFYKRFDKLVNKYLKDD